MTAHDHKLTHPNCEDYTVHTVKDNRVTPPRITQDIVCDTCGERLGREGANTPRREGSNHHERPRVLAGGRKTREGHCDGSSSSFGAHPHRRYPRCAYCGKDGPWNMGGQQACDDHKRDLKVMGFTPQPRPVLTSRAQHNKAATLPTSRRETSSMPVPQKPPAGLTPCDPRVSADPTAAPRQESTLGRWHYYTTSNTTRTAETGGDEDG